VDLVDTTSTSCPWLGLSSYSSTEASLFFGRSRAARSLVRLLDRDNLVGVVGASGSGKSSLLSAGLVREGWSPVTIRPGADPFVALDPACARLSESSSSAQVLVVDQLEQIFTLAHDEIVRRAYLDRLCELAEQGTKVAVALRSDHYGSCAAYPRFAELLTRSHVLLGAPTEHELREIVRGPAEIQGLTVSDELLAEIIDDVLGEPGALPLLSHALAETWRRRSSDRLEWAAYEEAGGVRGAIAQTAEQAWTMLSPDHQRVARSMLVQLAEPGNAPLDTSRRMPLAVLLPGGDSVRRAVLDALVASRIVAVDGNNVEIAHEAVFREWPRLRDWLSADRASVRALNNLRHAAEQWAEAGCEPSMLLRGTRLAEARHMAASDQMPIDEVVREFVEAAQSVADDELSEIERRALATQRSNRRLRMLLTMVAVLAVVAATAGFVAFRRAGDATRERDIADARRLAAAAGAIRADNGDLAALLAAEAFDLRQDDQTVGAMLSALTARPGLQAYLHDDFAFTAVGLGRSGDLLGVDDSPLGVGLWDLAGDQPVRIGALEAGEDASVVGLGFVDDDRVAVIDAAGMTTMFDVDTRAVLWSVSVSDSSTVSLAVSPDRSLLAVGDEVGSVTVLSGEDGRVVQQVVLDDGSLNALAFSADGLVLTGGSSSGQLVSWSTASWSTEGPSYAFDAELWSMSYDPSGSLLAVGTDADLFALDASTGEVVGGPLNAHNGIVHDLVFTDPTRLMSVGEDGRLLVWDTERFELARPAINAHAAGVLAVAVDPPTGRVVTAGEDLRLGIWSLFLDNAIADPLSVGEPAVAGVALSDDGLFALAGRDGIVRFTRVDTDRIGAEAPIPPDIAVAEGPLSGVALSADGSVVAAVELAGTAHVVRVDSGEPVVPPIAVGSRSSSISMDPSGRWLAVSETDGDCTACILVIDLEHPDDDPIRLRSTLLEEGAPNKAGYAASFDETGSWLVAGDNSGYVDLWQVPEASADSNGEFSNVWSIKLERGIRSLAFSHDGNTIAIGATGGVLLIVDAGTGEEVQRLNGQRGRVGGLAFSPDDALLVSTGPDEALARIWQLSSGTPFTTPIDTGASWVAVPAWSVDGFTLILPTLWGGPMAYDMDPADMRNAICTLAQRNLTEREWHQYVADARPYEPTCPGVAAAASTSST
jgi:WD40 repeat protein